MEMTINSKCGEYNVNIIENGDGSFFLAIANMKILDSETMSNTSYWFTIGRYKTQKGAIRQSIKKMADYNIELSIG